MASVLIAGTLGPAGSDPRSHHPHRNRVTKGLDSPTGSCHCKAAFSPEAKLRSKRHRKSPVSPRSTVIVRASPPLSRDMSVWRLHSSEFAYPSLAAPPHQDSPVPNQLSGCGLGFCGKAPANASSSAVGPLRGPKSRLERTPKQIKVTTEPRSTGDRNPTIRSALKSSPWAITPSGASNQSAAALVAAFCHEHGD